MFARKFRLTLQAGEAERPVPRDWLDQFFMRNFTGYSAFDETLAAGDGLLEASFRVPPEEIQSRFEQWLRGRRMIGAQDELRISAANERGSVDLPQHQG